MDSAAAHEGTHQHLCSQCGAVWEHCHDSKGRNRDHICPQCGYLELMVFKPGAPPMGPADHPQAVANFVQVLTDPDESARRAAAFSLGSLRAEPDRAIPGLALAAIGDRQPSVRQAAVDALRRFDRETCREASGCLWPALTGLL
jgi:hypothetical protein